VGGVAARGPPSNRASPPTDQAQEGSFTNGMEQPHAHLEPPPTQAKQHMPMQATESLGALPAWFRADHGVEIAPTSIG